MAMSMATTRGTPRAATGKRKRSGGAVLELEMEQDGEEKTNREGDEVSDGVDEDYVEEGSGGSDGDGGDDEEQNETVEGPPVAGREPAEGQENGEDDPAGEETKGEEEDSEEEAGEEEEGVVVAARAPSLAQEYSWFLRNLEHSGGSHKTNDGLVREGFLRGLRVSGSSFFPIALAESARCQEGHRNHKHNQARVAKVDRAATTLMNALTTRATTLNEGTYEQIKGLIRGDVSARITSEQADSDDEWRGKTAQELIAAGTPPELCRATLGKRWWDEHHGVDGAGGGPAAV